MAKKVYTGRTMLVSKRVNTIPGFEKVRGFYRVLNDGRIFGKDGREVGLGLDRGGYRRITLLGEGGYRKAVLVHRLVAFAFIPNPDNKPQIDHIDRNKENNHINNLRWSTSSENNRNKDWNKLKDFYSKNNTNHKTLSKPVIATCVKTGVEFYYPSQMEAERAGFTGTHISRCLRGGAKTHGGMKWRGVSG